jgi:transposase
MKKYGLAETERRAVHEQQAEVRRFKAELKRVTKERDILKKAARTLPRRRGKVRVYPRA